MKILLGLALIMSCSFSNAQSFFNGNWHYFDNDGNYYELTISKKHIYVYVDSGDVSRYKLRASNSKISFNNKTWRLQVSDSSSQTFITESGETIKLYKFLAVDGELVHFYNWQNATNKNGNGYMILWRDASNRRNKLLETLKSKSSARRSL